MDDELIIKPQPKEYPLFHPAFDFKAELKEVPNPPTVKPPKPSKFEIDHLKNRGWWVQ